MIRQIIFYKDYFREFFDEQEEKVKEKIDFVLDLIANVERVPEKFLKHLTATDGLYEIRVKSGSNIFRIFCFFDEGKLVVLLHGFQKKTDKKPPKELERAKGLKKEYFTEKAKRK
jgi:phage-related protein